MGLDTGLALLSSHTAELLGSMQRERILAWCALHAALLQL
jgi:hypothetical protein